MGGQPGQHCACCCLRQRLVSPLPLPPLLGRAASPRLGWGGSELGQAPLVGLLRCAGVTLGGGEGAARRCPAGPGVAPAPPRPHSLRGDPSVRMRLRRRVVGCGSAVERGHRLPGLPAPHVALRLPRVGDPHCVRHLPCHAVVPSAREPVPDVHRAFRLCAKVRLLGSGGGKGAPGVMPRRGCGASGPFPPPHLECPNAQCLVPHVHPHIAAAVESTVRHHAPLERLLHR